jgi:hypothetical protein
MELQNMRSPRMASRLSPYVATVLLTAAAFLLPSPGDGQTARAAVDEVSPAASHVTDRTASQRY